METEVSAPVYLPFPRPDGKRGLVRKRESWIAIRIPVSVVYRWAVARGIWGFVLTCVSGFAFSCVSAFALNAKARVSICDPLTGCGGASCGDPDKWFIYRGQVSCMVCVRVWLGRDDPAFPGIHGERCPRPRAGRAAVIDPGRPGRRRLRRTTLNERHSLARDHVANRK